MQKDRRQGSPLGRVRSRSSGAATVAGCHELNFEIATLRWKAEGEEEPKATQHDAGQDAEDLGLPIAPACASAGWKPSFGEGGLG